MNRNSLGGVRTLGPIQGFGGAGGDIPLPPNNIIASPTGNDTTGTGSASKPFLTAQKAHEIIQFEGGGTVTCYPNTPATRVPGMGLGLRGVNDLGIGGANWVDTPNAYRHFQVPANSLFLGFPVSELAPLGGGPWLSCPLEVCGSVSGAIFDNLACISVFGAFPASRWGLSSTLSPSQAWNIGTSYALAALVTFGGAAYMSNTAGNVGNQPDISTVDWISLRPGLGDALGPSLSALIQRNNCYFQRNGNHGYPASDHGFMFWVTDNFVNNSRFYVDGTDPLTDCAARYYASPNTGGVGTATYYYVSTNGKVNGGGLYSVGNNEFTYVNSLTSENMVMPPFWAVPGVSGDATGWFKDLRLSDSSTPFAGRNDCSNIMVGEACDALTGMWDIKNPPVVSTFGIQGQIGDVGRESRRQQDTGRRGGVITSRDRPNYAVPITLYGEAVGVPYCIGPFGEPIAAKLAVQGTYDHNIYNQGNAGTPALLVDDVIQWGIWDKWISVLPNSSTTTIRNSGTQPITIELRGTATTGCKEVTLGPGDFTNWLPIMDIKIGQWAWVSGYIKVTAITAGASLVIVDGCNGPGDPRARAWPQTDIYGAAEGFTDSELAQRYLHMHPTAQQPYQSGDPFSLPFVQAPLGNLIIPPGTGLSFIDTATGLVKTLTIAAGITVVT